MVLLSYYGTICLDFHPVLAFSLSNARKKNMYVDINALSRKSEKNINACALASSYK